MDFFEFLNNWFTNHPVTTSIIKYFLWLILAVTLIQFLRRIFKETNTGKFLTIQGTKSNRNFWVFVYLILTISYFTGNIKDFRLAIGLFTAGIPITFKNLF